MSIQKNSKINALLQQYYQHSVITQHWLTLQGYSRPLVKRYLTSGWLTKLGHGAYFRTGDQPTWQGAVFALQKQLQLPIHIGGRTALHMLGKAHYIGFAPEKDFIELYSHSYTNKISWPKWFNHYDWGISFTLNCSFLLEYEPFALQDMKISEHTFELTISTPERAMLEFLEGVPHAHMLDEGYYLMEGLVSLRPKVVQTVLHNCRSYKAKRLFLLLADVCQHAWFNHLKLEQINLGKGKRKIGTGGKYYAKYQLSIPPLPKENLPSEDIP